MGDLQLAQPLAQRMDALVRLNSMAIGDLITSELWPVVRDLLEVNLSFGEKEYGAEEEVVRVSDYSCSKPIPTEFSRSVSAFSIAHIRRRRRTRSATC